MSGTNTAHGKANQRFSSFGPGTRTVLVLFLASLFALLLLLLLSPLSSAADVRISLLSTPLPREPGENVTLLYSIENTGAGEARYNISYGFEYNWSGEILGIAKDDEAVDYNMTEYGFATREFLAPGELLMLEFLVQLPELTTDRDLNSELGLDTGTKGTISLHVGLLGDEGDGSQHSSELIVTSTHFAHLSALTQREAIGTVGPEARRTVLFYLTVTHLTNTEESERVDLSVSGGIEMGWQAFFSTDSVGPLDNLEEAEVTFSVVAPYGFEVNEKDPYWNINITGTSRTFGKSTVLRFNLTLEKQGSVNLFTPTPARVLVTPGELIFYNVTLQNTGNFRDRYSLSHESGKFPYWVKFQENLTGYLEPLENITVVLEIFIDSLRPPEIGTSDMVKLVAVSELGAGSVQDSVHILLEVGEKAAAQVTLEQDSFLEVAGENITTTLVIRNIGNCVANFSLGTRENVSYLGAALSWDIRDSRKWPWKAVISPFELFLRPDEQQDVLLTIQVPKKGFFSEVNNLSVVVNRELPGKPLEELNETMITITVDKIHDFFLSMESITLFGVPGETIPQSLLLRNTGNFPLLVVASVGNATPSGRSTGELTASLIFHSARNWDILFEFPEQINVSPFEDVSLPFRTMVKEFTVNGTKDAVSVEMSYQDDNVSLSMETGFEVEAKQYFKINITTLATGYKIVPGGSSEFELIIHNEGNGQDTLLLNVTEPQGFTSLPRTIQMTISPFSTITQTLNISMGALGEDSPAWNSRHRAKVELHSLLNLSARTEFFTPWMTVSFLGIGEPEDITDQGIESIYRQNFDVGDLNDVVCEAEAYIYNNRSIAFPLMLYNLDFGDDISFVVRDMALPSFLSYRLVDLGFNEIQDNTVVLENLQPRKVYLVFTAGDFNSSVNGFEDPITFRMNLFGDEIDNEKSLTNSFSIRFHFLRLDIWLAGLEIDEDVIEGRNVVLKTTIYLSEGELGKPINSGIDEIDYIAEMKINIYMDGKLLTRDPIVLTNLLISSEQSLEYQWKTPRLEWFEKEREVSLKVEVVSYEGYQGTVDYNHRNNEREKDYTILDATVTDLSVQNKLISIFFHLLIIGLIALFNYKIYGSLQMVSQKGQYARLIAAQGIFAILQVSFIFNLPWNLLFDVTNQHINILLSGIFLVLFPCVAWSFGRMGTTIPRAGLAAALSVLMLPLFITTTVSGALFWMGFEEGVSEFTHVLYTGSFTVGGILFELPLILLMVIYISCSLVTSYRFYKQHLLLSKLLQDMMESTKSRKARARLEASELEKRVKSFLEREIY